ncbi:MAG: APC family permease [Dehalococcoidia bacterium]
MNAPPDTASPGFRRALTYFDLTNMTVGAIVGADIYIAAAITAGLLGPASLLAWLCAGILATVIALTLAECASVVPEVGGPYAYVRKAFGAFPGFLAGWSMWIAEMTALPVFAIAFTNYLEHFVSLSDVSEHALRIAFLAVLATVNILSVRTAGRVNDALTFLKLLPLLLLVVGGTGYLLVHIDLARDNLTPLAPLGFDEFPTALVLVFWAFAGFELSTVPAGEVRDPMRTIPRALATGMAIVTLFYLSTNFVLYALLPHGELANSATPLAAASAVVFGSIGATIMSAGAIVSVSGSDESDMLGSSRLSYAMAADGLLPYQLATIHSRFRTPYVALLAQAAIAIGLTFVDQLATLISFAVFNLTFSFALSALALIVLRRSDPRHRSPGRRALPYLAVVISVGLLLATSWQDKLAGAAVLGIGLLVFAVAKRTPHPSPEVHEIKAAHTRNRLTTLQDSFLGRLRHWRSRQGA